MHIVIVGLNHRTAPVEVREQIAIGHLRQRDVLARLLAQPPIQEAVVLSTCNRVEVYTAGTEATPMAEAAQRVLLEQAAVPNPGLEAHFYNLQEPDSIRHLFRVVSGLDALVVGEREIVGQVKQAYETARKAGATNANLNALFQRALAVSKRVRTDTSIDRGTTSVASTAVDLAKKIFGELSQQRIMIVGTGETGELTLKHLVENGAVSVIASNRSFDKAVSLAERYGGQAVRFDHRIKQMVHVDIVVSCTACPAPIITRAEVHEVMRQRHDRSLFFIDLAVPRDIDPEANTLDNVYLYNIDDLRLIAEENLARRQRETQACEAIIDEETTAFALWLNSLGVSPALERLRAQAERLREREVTKTLRRLRELPTDAQAEIEHLSQRLVRALLHAPTTRIKRLVRQHGSGPALEMVQQLFGINTDNQERHES